MRSYGQYCGLARALDVVGDRWNLLVVRQLLLGPARYRELADGMPGIATNLLADRLRHLEAAGVLERRLGASGAAVTYALTPWGAELREPVESLIRWSTPLMIRGADRDHFQPHWLLLALSALLRDAPRPRRSATVGVAVDGETIQLRATRSGVDVAPHDGRDLDAVLHADAQVVLGLASGMLATDDVASLITVEGDEAAVRTVFARRTRQ